jgi:hypothetical protein
MGWALGGGISMGSFFNSGPLPSWSEIKRWLGDAIPWEMAEQWDGGDGEWLDKFMSKWMNDAQVPPVKSRDFETSVRAKAGSDPYRLTVTFRLPKGASAQRIRLYANSERLRITGLPDGRTQLIRFPGRVFPESGRATIRGGRLRAIFRRRPAEDEEVELFIRP